MTGKIQKELVLRSVFEEVERLEPFLNELQETVGFNNEDYARLMLTLSEAATNAIVHGNLEDPEKQVKITASLHDGSLEVVVQDEGEGFNPEDIPDPLKEERLLMEGGRGVYLINEYADKVDFSEDGTKLIMTFKLEKQG